MGEGRRIKKQSQLRFSSCVASGPNWPENFSAINSWLVSTSFMKSVLPLMPDNGTFGIPAGGGVIFFTFRFFPAIIFFVSSGLSTARCMVLNQDSDRSHVILFREQIVNNLTLERSESWFKTMHR